MACTVDQSDPDGASMLFVNEQRRGRRRVICKKRPAGHRVICKKKRPRVAFASLRPSCTSSATPAPTSLTLAFEIASHGILFTPFSRHTRRFTPIQRPTRHRNRLNEGHLTFILQLKLSPNMLPRASRCTQPHPIVLLRLQPTPTRRRPPRTQAAPLASRSAPSHLPFACGTFASLRPSCPLLHHASWSRAMVLAINDVGDQ